jgi:broad specificity phosphatase PhoE
MTIYLVRHAKAGSRSGWEGPDDQRPVSKAGRRQAVALAEALASPPDEKPITRIISSPYVRCRQTVEPLGERLLTPVDLAEALAEGSPCAAALVLVDKYADEDVVLCSHGDVIGDLLSHFQHQGVHLDDDKLEKGSTWVLDLEAGAVIAARYVPPPAK